MRLTPEQMQATYLVRHLAPLFDLYVNDAFATAHRASPSMIAFQRLLPSAAGLQLTAEVEGLRTILDRPTRPAVFLLGGLKVSDGFSVMGRALRDGLADRVLTAGVLGEIFLLADGITLGRDTEAFIGERDLTRYVTEASALLAEHRDRIALPVDIAVVADGERREIAVSDLPTDTLIVDVGEATISTYESEIAHAGSVFVNGPPGAYEQIGSDIGTRRLWTAVAAAPGRTAIGGGDTVASAARFVELDDIGFVSTAGGALIRFVSGETLPLLEAFRTSGHTSDSKQPGGAASGGSVPFVEEYA